MSAPKSRNVKFDPIIGWAVVRGFQRTPNNLVQTLECMTIILWKSEQKSKNKPTLRQFERWKDLKLRFDTPWTGVEPCKVLKINRFEI